MGKKQSQKKAIPLQSSGAGCVGFDEERIYISTQKQYLDFDDLQEHAMAFRQSWDNGYAVIELKNIREIVANERTPDFFVRYTNAKGKTRKYYLRLKDKQGRIEFCDDLADTCKLRSRFEEENRFLQFGVNLVLAVLAGLLTWGIVYFSEHESRHTQRALAYLATQLFKVLGPTVCLVIGSMVTGFFVFRITRNYFYPRKTIRYF